MNVDQFIELMRERLTAAFDITNPPENLGFDVALWAVHNRLSEKYFLAKRVSLYTIKNDEYVGLHVCSSRLTREKLLEIFEQSKKLLSNMKVDEDHMSSLFAITLVCPYGIENEVIQAVKTMKYHRDYRFTLRGWSDLALLVVDLERQEIHTNPQGQKLKKFYSCSEIP